MNYLLYQAYGNKANINEAKFSILSFLKISSLADIEATSIVIYTDQPEQFDLFNSIKSIIVQHVTKETIQGWYGKIGFLHRAKIKIIEDFFSKFPSSNLLYVDTDTYFITNPAPVFAEIANGNIFMHLFEGIPAKNQPNSLKGSFGRRMRKLINDNTFVLPTGKEIKFSESMEFWNAGAIGINSSYASLIPEVEALTDTIHKVTTTHIIEQIAFCYVLQTHAKINGLTNTIFHYWNFKELRPTLERFFENNKNEPLEKLIEHSTSILNPVQLIKPKMAYEKLPGWRRAIQKVLVKDRWDRSQLEAAANYTIN